MFDGRAFHSLAVVGKNCIERVSNLEKHAVMFARATGIVFDILY